MRPQDEYDAGSPPNTGQVSLLHNHFILVAEGKPVSFVAAGMHASSEGPVNFGRPPAAMLCEPKTSTPEADLTQLD